MVWNGQMKDGMLVANETYNALYIRNTQDNEHRAYQGIWDNSAPLKMKLFLWLVLMDKNLTWENLKRKGKIGPGICKLCMMEDEDNTHLFYLCDFTKNVLKMICEILKMQVPKLESTKEFILWWQ